MNIGPAQWRGKGAALGVLLTNLGTPTAPTPRAVRHFLREFLSDPRVIELPRWLWLPLLHGIVLRLRPRYAARAYARIWGEQGSPLLTHSEHQAARLEERLALRLGDGVKVVLGMRYGQPSIGSALEALRAAGVGRLLVLPLFPQYSAVTTASVFDAVARTLRSWRRLPEVRMPMGYHDDPGYITAVAHAIRMAFEAHGVPDRLLFSFHGLPRDAAERGDPYGDQCQATARLVADSMGLEPDRWQVAFQSKVGPRAWLAPYTLETLTAWARAGVRSVQVVCPGFAADCLETLEEIDIRYREAFLEAGGEDFHYISALNDSPQHIEVLWQLVARHGRGWIDAALGSPVELGVYGLNEGEQQDHEQDHEAER
ncbi:MAG: ferrochelatase [Pseudomonadota bacterium]|nr:ferrochelatase [Pseudomonadota bacterium]